VGGHSCPVKPQQVGISVVLRLKTISRVNRSPLLCVAALCHRCGGIECWQADDVMIAQRGDRFQGHVASALDGLFVVPLEQDCSDETNGEASSVALQLKAQQRVATRDF
jgi:hypothetical protein